MVTELQCSRIRLPRDCTARCENLRRHKKLFEAVHALNRMLGQADQSDKAILALTRLGFTGLVVPSLVNNVPTRPRHKPLGRKLNRRRSMICSVVNRLLAISLYPQSRSPHSPVSSQVGRPIREAVRLRSLLMALSPLTRHPTSHGV